MEELFKQLDYIYRTYGIEGLFAVSGWVFAFIFPIIAHYFYRQRLAAEEKLHQQEMQRSEARWKNLVDTAKENDKKWREMVESHQEKLIEVVTDVTQYNTLLVEKLSLIQNIMLSLVQRNGSNGSGR